MEPRSFEDEVRRVLERLVPGMVMTYGEVALEAGRPGACLLYTSHRPNR